jgi:hypothetical protein
MCSALPVSRSRWRLGTVKALITYGSFMFPAGIDERPECFDGFAAFKQMPTAAMIHQRLSSAAVGTNLPSWKGVVAGASRLFASPHQEIPFERLLKSIADRERGSYDFRHRRVVENE